jgi:predicted ATPase
MALHTGEADLRAGDYYGAAVNRCARLRAVAHGGQVLVSQTTHDLVRGTHQDGSGFTDLGEHRLRDLTAAERVFQLTAPGLPDSFPPLRSLDSLPNNLPRQLTSFVGRERELAEVKRLLASSPLVTLTGTGGCGKTRVALQVAADLLDTYPDGVWLVELASVTDAVLVPDTVASALGVRGSPTQPIQATLLSYLRDRRLLILLDNCEHLLDTCARLTDVILRRCPHVQILATSRELLGIAGEVSWRTPSLSLPPGEPQALLTALADSEAVRLFVERATAVQPAFALTAQNAQPVAQICRRLDGIPLAIELAATRVRALALEQIGARLDQRFRLLTGGSRTALPRQQTLAATVSWSYDLLSEPERTLFNRLSVFVGGFTLEAAEAVCGVSGIDVLDLLTALVDKSLVLVGPDDSVRYRLLETMRQFGRERLVAVGEAEALHRRHADYYLALVENAGPHLLGQEQLPYLNQLDAEADNLRVALQWFVESGDAPSGLRLATVVQQWLYYRGRVSEGRGWLERLLLLPEARERNALRASALGWLGRLVQFRGDEVASHRQAKEAMTIAEEIGDRQVLANVLSTTVGWSDTYRVDAALAVAREIGDQRLTSQTLSSLGRTVHYQGDLHQAREYLEESIELARTVGERWTLGLALEVTGELISAEDDDKARGCLEESLRLYRELGDLGGVASVEYYLGRLDCLHGRFVSGAGHFRASLRITKDWAWILRITQSYDGLAIVAAALGRPERALRLASASARERDAAGQPPIAHERAELEIALAPILQTLSKDRVVILQAEGRAMTRGQAITYALRENGDA